MEHSIFVTVGEFLQHKALREGKPIYNKHRDCVGLFHQMCEENEFIEVKNSFGRVLEHHINEVFVQVIVEPIWI